MADFKSDSIDAVSTYSYIPTGGIVTIAGAFSEYSDSAYVSLGLIPCDGRTLSRTTYANLWNTFGTTFTGASTTASGITVSGLSGMDNATHTGWGISGTNIQPGSTILTVINSTSVLISQVASGTAAGTATIAISPYGFSGGGNTTTFNIPNLKTNKVSIVGASNTFYNVNTVGTQVNSIAHSHTTSATNNSFSMNAGNTSHDHTLSYNDVGNMVSEGGHAHNRLNGPGNLDRGAAGTVNTMNATRYRNGPAGTAGGGLNGNHTHTMNLNANALGSGGGNDHTHSGVLNHNTGYNSAISHTHGSTVTNSANTSSSTYSSSNTLGVPYANMVYFIKA
jgi:hypothetical protein